MPPLLRIIIIFITWSSLRCSPPTHEMPSIRWSTLETRRSRLGWSVYNHRRMGPEMSWDGNRKCGQLPWVITNYCFFTGGFVLAEIWSPPVINCLPYATRYNYNKTPLRHCPATQDPGPPSHTVPRQSYFRGHKNQRQINLSLDSSNLIVAKSKWAVVITWRAAVAAFEANSPTLLDS